MEVKTQIDPHAVVPARRAFSRRDAVLMLAGAPLAALVAVRRRGWSGLAEAWAKSPAPDASAALSGAGAVDALASAARRPLPACVARPEQTEGPYFVDERLKRVDIRVDPSDGKSTAGVPMKLRFNVSRIDSTDCTPLKGVVVDVWHCDAAGTYSDVIDPSFSTKGKKYLRGYQVTDADGVAEFQTIYPGWYQGRTVHIHFKIRTDPDAPRGYEFTSQLYFDDAVTDKVYQKAPYAAKGIRNQRNTDDGIYRQGGSELLVVLTEDGEGYLATFDIGLEGVGALPTATPGAPQATATPAPTDAAPTAVPPVTNEPTQAPRPTVAPTRTPRATAAPTEPAAGGSERVYLPQVRRKY